jgi:hypothetical protein
MPISYFGLRTLPLIVKIDGEVLNAYQVRFGFCCCFCRAFVYNSQTFTSCDFFRLEFVCIVDVE